MTELALQSDPALAAPEAPHSLRQELEHQFHDCGVIRPFERARYDPGHRLEYQITGVARPLSGRMLLEVQKFVGGGFAGQVYRVELLEVETPDGAIDGLIPGNRYAIKILKPPSGFARAFRDFLYFLAYQGRFGAQVHPASVRVGVLWQKLIRRAAATRFGTESAVCDTYATFYDEALHSFGEINEWIEGRIWKFEVDDRLFDRWKFDGRPPADHNAPEYVHKKLFMKELVALLHEMGAPELARQYEWWTLKSQPNALKRLATEGRPDQGLTAVDFRAGLALLPFLPMSPADVALIVRGLAKGRIVQFDRSDPERFRRFLEEHRREFEGLEPVIEELQRQETTHWRSLPDVTGHHARLFTDAELRRSIRLGTITGWRNLGWLDAARALELEQRAGLFGLLSVISWIPLLGGFVVRLWGSARLRDHLRRCWTRIDYLRRAVRASRIETLIVWHRDERCSDRSTRRLVDRPVRFWLQSLLLGWMPPQWHRSIAEPRHGWSRVREGVRFLSDFLRHPHFRENWLLEQVELGRQEGMLTPEEAERVTHQIQDPYIQKYLKCLAVHLCTVPITQVVMLLVGAAVVAYFLAYRQMSWAQSLGFGTAAAAAVQLAPISPGSLARGLFVIYLMIKERDIRNYYVAAPISFIHVIGYLAFPLQMVNHDPALARFMAGRWAKQLVGAVPVFGERGGLLEHSVFDTFFNLPVSIRRGFRTNPARWSAGTALALAMLVLFGLLGYARIWEIRQPKVELHDVEVASIAPYRHRAGGELHWHYNGFRVRFSTMDEPVDYPAHNWDPAVSESDRVDATIRRSFFGKEYDGLKVTRH